MTTYRLTARGRFAIIAASLAFLIVCGILASGDTLPAPCNAKDSHHSK